MLLERASARQWVDSPVPGHQVATIWNHSGDGCYFAQFVAGASFPLHDHEGWEHILMLSGRVRFGEHELDAGDSLMLERGDVHSALALTDATFFVAHRGDIQMID
ncbi:MAG: cupin domain-containing protein [Sphingomonadaceae bacterium]